MTLQQLRYLIAIAECGSISGAAHNLFISQSSLSVAVREIEAETGVTIFKRSNRGITITNDGTELLGYARQIVEQADLMTQRYGKKDGTQSQRLAVSAQHYSFVVEAFVQLVERQSTDEYDLILRETRTNETIQDVSEFRSDIGIIYLDKFNSRILSKTLSDAGLSFTSLFTTKPHVFVGEGHPLSKKKFLTIDDLAPWPRYSFEQGTNNSFFFSEEPLSSLPHKKKITISDRGTLANLLTNFNGYTISTGVLSNEMVTGIVSIPLETDEEMNVGYILHDERKPSDITQEYIETLKSLVESYEW